LIDSDNGVQPNRFTKRSEPNRKRGNKQSPSNRSELSIRDREISNLRKLLRSIPDVRKDKIEELRKKTKGGTYNIDAEKIAEKIIKGNPQF
jgi:negative regulator of flagellin synthesis FlgM